MDARELARPNRLCFTEDDDRWYSISISHPSVLIPVSGTPTVRYINAYPSSEAITTGAYYRSRGGVCYFPTPGVWYVNLPLAGSSPAKVCFVLLDCASPESAKILADVIGSYIDANLVRVGGMAQTPADIAYHFASASWSEETAVTVTTTSQTVLSIYNRPRAVLLKADAANAVPIWWAAPGSGGVAQVGYGIPLDPGESICLWGGVVPRTDIHAVVASGTATLYIAGAYH